MKLLLNLLKISGIAFIAAVFIAGVLIYFSSPKLPDDIDKIIDETIESDLPELIKGKTGYAQSGNTRIWFESIGQSGMEKGAILLFMGISNDALGWPQGFIDSLADSGYQVIRFDYRGTGMSDWIKGWKNKPYSLSDMASDAVATLDALGIKRAHLLGISLGGMVAQEFAINHPKFKDSIV